MKVSKNSKYQTHKKSIKLTKNPNDRTGAPVELSRTILVSSCGLKKKSHYNSRVSLHEAPTKNIQQIGKK